LQATYDDYVALLQAIAHDAQVVRHRTKFHGSIYERVVLAKDENVFLIQIGDDSLVSRQAAVLHAASLQANPCEQPRR
jgi:hypothetical protein